MRTMRLHKRTNSSSATSARRPVQTGCERKRWCEPTKKRDDHGMHPRASRKKILEEVYAHAFEFEQEYGSCPQCVLAAIQDTFQTADPAVFKAAYALGGGVALTTDGTCGALAGGVMALCCKYGRTRENFAKGRHIRSLEERNASA